jgi:argininosuccinate synthase
MNAMKEKLVLAYSGGLDTSVILKLLVLKGYDVITFTADIGQPDVKDLQKVKEKALKTGASNAYVVDLKEEFVKDYVLPVFATGAIYEDRYLLGTSVARPLIAKQMIEIVEKEGATTISHGCTGKGNDQVRFELSAYALKHDIKVFAPWRDQEFLKQFEGRADLINFAKENNIPIEKLAESGRDYSEDGNLLHLSHEAGMLEDPGMECPESVYSWITPPEKAPDKVTKIKLSFVKGILSGIENLDNKTKKTKPLEMFQYLNELGAANGVGMLDMVEDRYVGIKSRGIYETPGGTILHNAVKDLYGITMDKELFRINQLNSIKIAELIYNGYWFSNEMCVCMKTAEACLENVTGDVIVKIYKGNVFPIYRTSSVSLYNQATSSMDVAGGFDQSDSTGFIRINSVRLKLSNFKK